MSARNEPDPTSRPFTRLKLLEALSMIAATGTTRPPPEVTFTASDPRSSDEKPAAFATSLICWRL